MDSRERLWGVSLQSSRIKMSLHFHPTGTLLACRSLSTPFPHSVTGFFWEYFLNRSFYSNHWLRYYFWKNFFLRCPYNYKGELWRTHVGILLVQQWTAGFVNRLELSSAPIFCSHLPYFLAHKAQQWICIMDFSRFPIILFTCQEDIVVSVFKRFKWKFSPLKHCLQVNHIHFFKILFIYLLIFGCIGSSLLRAGFL